VELTFGEGDILLRLPYDVHRIHLARGAVSTGAAGEEGKVEEMKQRMRGVDRMDLDREGAQFSGQGGMLQIMEGGHLGAARRCQR
jgi:hypothetical protein